MGSRDSEKIVFLDAGTLDYADLPFQEIEKLGNLKVYGATRYDQTAARLKDAAAVVTNKCVIDRAVLQALPLLRVIHVSATGVNNIDLRAAAERKVAVTNAAGYSTESVVQFTIGFILALAGNLVKFDGAVHRGDWCRSPFFVLPAYPISEVSGKTLSIVGYGAIGRRVAEVAKVLGMRVLIAKIPGCKYTKAEAKRRVAMERVLKEADYLTVHTPLTPLTAGLIDRAALRRMKRSACLINMARGGIVDELALHEHLKKRLLAGAATDVLTQEPPARNHKLLKTPDLLITPHVAWSSLEARKRLIREVALNIRAFQNGKRRNRVI